MPEQFDAAKTREELLADLRELRARLREVEDTPPRAAAPDGLDLNAALASSRRALEASEARYRAIFESALDYAMIAMDLAGRVTDWNAGAVRILGWTAEEMKGRSAEIFFTPEDRAAHIAAQEMESALTRGRGMDERWHLRRDGTRFWASGEMMTLRDEAGRAIGFIKILRDRTDQRLAEERLLKAQEQLHLAVAATDAGIFDYDLVTDTLGWDARTRELFGLPPGAEVSYETFLSGLHPDDRAWVDEAVQASLDPAGNGAYDVEYRTLGLADGRERWVAARGQAYFAKGRATRLIGTARDITDKKRAAQALRDTEERYRLAAKATNDAIWDWDFRTNHVLWNEALTEAYGHAPADVEPTGEWWLAQIHPDDRERIDHSIHGVIDGGGSDWQAEYRFRRADGSYADIYDRGHVIHDAAGRPVRIIGAMLDLTRVQQAEAALRESQRELAVERGLLQAVFQQAPLGISITLADGKGQINTRMREMLGHDEGGEGDERYRDFGALHGDGRSYEVADYPTLRALRGGETVTDEPMIYRNGTTGEARRWEVSATPVRDAQGRILAAVTLAIDVEDRHRAEERRGILNRELSHRLKNTLAIVSSIATQTLRSAPDMATARGTLTERIGALSKAHDILLVGHRDAAPLGEIVAQATAPHDPGGQVERRGPAVPLGPKASLTLSLILHELATNAVKYGALSAPEGRVLVSWEVTPDPETRRPNLVFEWRETGGPPVLPPTRRSFGTRLIEMGLSGSVGGASQIAYDRRGLTCRITASLTEVRAEEGVE